MKLLVVFSFCVLTANASFIDVFVNLFGGSANNEEKKLIKAVITLDYDSAVTQTLELYKNSKGNIIEDVISRLIKDSRNIFEYAYKLWISSGQEIVTKYFADPFTQLLSEKDVKLIFVRDNLAMKLGAATDDMHDRIAYGDANDKTSENVSWKLLPSWENNTIYFKIQSVRREQYLKLGTAADSSGDHIAYGSDKAETHRHEWYLKPAELDGKIVFFIYNRQYDQALKLGRATDQAGDRNVYSHAQPVDGQPDLFGWYINP